MRTFSILKESIVPYMSTLVTQLTEKIIAVSKVGEVKSPKGSRATSW